MLHQVKYSLTNLVCAKSHSEIAGMSLKHIHQIGHSSVLHIQNIVLCKDRDKSKACVGDSLKWVFPSTDDKILVVCMKFYARMPSSQSDKPRINRIRHIEWQTNTNSYLTISPKTLLQKVKKIMMHQCTGQCILQGNTWRERMKGLHEKSWFHGLYDVHLRSLLAQCATCTVRPVLIYGLCLWKIRPDVWVLRSRCRNMN